MIEGYTDRFVEGDADSVEEALYLMRRASVMVRGLEEYFARFGLSQLQFLILVVIDRELDRSWLHQRELSDRLDVSKPVLTRTATTLMRKGWLEIEPDSDDRRSKRLYLTSAGKAILKKIMPGYFTRMILLLKEGTD